MHNLCVLEISKTQQPSQHHQQHPQQNDCTAEKELDNEDNLG